MNNLVQLLETTDKIKSLLNRVDRYYFCTDKQSCYLDRASKLILPSGDTKQTISAPHMHAKSLEFLEPILIPGNKILDIGSGSGYLTACLGEAVSVYNNDEKLRGKVIGLEIDKGLSDYSINIINTNMNHLLKYKRNFKIIYKDGKLGYPSKSKEELYDGIHIGASCEYIPYYLITQLKKGGIMVIPLKIKDNNLIFCIVYKDKEGNIYIKEKIPVRYVPLI